MSNERPCIREDGCPHQFQGPCYGGCQAAADELIRLAQEKEPPSSARELADHIVSQPLDVIQAAFRRLGMQLRFEIDRAGEFTPAELDQLHDSLDQLRRGEVEPALPHRECAASISGNSLNEGEGETGCATEDGECVRAGVPANELAAAVSSCPGYETSPNPCRCPCYGCKHHCSAHNPDDVDAPCKTCGQPWRKDHHCAPVPPPADVRDHRMVQLEAGRDTWKAKAEQMERELTSVGQEADRLRKDWARQQRTVESATAHAEHLSCEVHRLATIVDSVRATATAHLPNPVAAGVLAELDQHANGHTYLSTSCLHGEHDYCKHNRGAAGMKVPAVCKFCGTGCICPCHTGHEPR